MTNNTGRKTVRDDEGKIRQSELSSEAARAMVAVRDANKVTVKKTRVEQLLRDRGVDPANCDEGLRSLAEIAVSNRSGAVSAMRYLDTLSGYFTPNNTGGIAPPLPGEACPTCGLWNITLTKELNATWPKLLQFLDRWRDEIEAEIVDKDAANTEKTTTNTELDARQ